MNARASSFWRSVAGIFFLCRHQFIERITMAQDQRTRRLKRILRRSIAATILALDPEERFAQELQIKARFSQLPGLVQAETILLYAKAFAEELDTGPLFWHLWGAGKRVIYPRVDRAGGGLRLYQIADPRTDLEPGALGIPEPRDVCPEVEPAEVDWALVPGIAFDSQCHRLGRGLGLYDRLLPRFRPDAHCWALCLDCQIVAELPLERHDQPLDGIATSRVNFTLGRSRITCYPSTALTSGEVK
jgi:5-formyltetrahydrofolate cyclo-ligase